MESIDDILDECERLDKAAKAGPWRLTEMEFPEDFMTTDDNPSRCNGIEDSKGREVVVTDSGNYPPNLPTAELIVYYRNYMPRLVDELRQAREFLQRFIFCAPVRHSALRDEIKTFLNNKCIS